MAASLLDTLRHRLGDRYAIDRQLGQGGMGAVYLARDLQLDRPLAIKVLPDEFATRPELRERFLRETRTAASFSHPNIVPVFAVEEREDVVAMAMGYVEGESLGERVARSGPLTIGATVRLIEDVAYALAYAHGRGVVHRDIKPDNIMVERATGRALVMDFGIARRIDTERGSRAGLTQVGEVVGTPEYMSPEQASGDYVDGRSDLYALGLVAWFALTGETAMASANSQQVLARQLTEMLPPISSLRGDVPTALSDAIARTLEKEPHDRFETAEALVAAVDVVRSGASEVPTPIRLMAQELDAVGKDTLVSVGVSALIWVLVREQGWDETAAYSQIAILLAVAAGRYVAAWQQARRLGALGFSASDVQRGFASLVQEQADARALLRLDAAFVRRRRRYVAAAVVALACFPLLTTLARSMRTQLEPGVWYVPPLAQALLLGSSILLGIASVVLFRSPLRMRPAERGFRLLWMGPIGGGLIRAAVELRTGAGAGGLRPSTRASAARGAARGSGSAARSNGSSAAGTATAPADPNASHRALESRVHALEAWREDAERRWRGSDLDRTNG